MKQIAQNYKSGELALLEVPVPAARPGGVLVRTQFSLISTGTEMMKINESKLSLVGKARARPDQVKKVMQSVSQQGLRATYRKVSDRLDSYTPLGYSLCGEVVEVGAGVEELAVGQRVACAGNSYALHAEYNWVPRNLCVPRARGGRLRARRLHHRRAPSPCRATGSRRRGWGRPPASSASAWSGSCWCRSCGRPGSTWSASTRRPSGAGWPSGAGAAACRPPDPASRGPVLETLAALTDGAGADHIFLTAGGDTNQPVELAAELARDRARVVDIGKCRLDLPWTEYYAKELDVRFSRSYGPGRYDPTYEEGGVDYPIGYVRWTERRNMACFLDLVAEGRLDLDPLVSAVLPFDDAVGAYERIQRGEQGGVGMLFRYSANGSAQRRLATAARPPTGPPAGRPAGGPARRDRGRQLRHQHAPAPPARPARRPAGRGGDRHRAVGGQRPAQVRLRALLDRPPGPAGRRGGRRRGDRHPPPRARGHGLRGPARPARRCSSRSPWRSTRTSSRRSWRRSPTAATTV